MRFPTSTGEAARLVGATEPRLNNLIRKGKIQPAPGFFAGRRQWEQTHILQAAEHLGLLTDDLRRRLGEEAAHVP